MTVERLRQIIGYSKEKRAEIEEKVRDFCCQVGIRSDREMLHILQMVRPAFVKKGYLTLEIPFADEEIGALCYRGDGLGYVVLNTSLPKVNVNFAVGHEVYHVFYPDCEFRPKIEFANHHYDEREEEFAANLFAGMLLMPEAGFRTMYHLFKEESCGDERDTVIRLMHYYQVPYMAALVRCFELGLPGTNQVTDELLKVDPEFVRARMSEMWLDDSILDATKKDDYVHLERIVNRLGGEYIQGAYLDERTLRLVLRNMRALYLEIKGE